MRAFLSLMLRFSI